MSNSVWLTVASGRDDPDEAEVVDRAGQSAATAGGGLEVDLDGSSGDGGGGD